MMTSPPFAVSPPRTAVGINHRFALSAEGAMRVVFLEGQPVMEFHESDIAGRDLVIVQMCEHSGLTETEVAQAFGVSRATVSRAKRSYEAGGAHGLLAGKTGPKSPTKLKDEKQKLMLTMARKGLRTTEIAGRLGVSESAVRKALRRLGWDRPAGSPRRLDLKTSREGACAEDTGKRVAGVAPEVTPVSEVECGKELQEEKGCLDGGMAIEPPPAAQTAGEAPVEMDAAAATGGMSEGDVEMVAAVAGRNIDLAAEAEMGGVDGSLHVPVTMSADTNPQDRSLDRALARMGLLEDAAPLFATQENVRSAGLLLAIPVLVAHGVFADAVRIFGSIGPAFYGIRNVVATLLLMFVARINRPEHLKEHSPAALGSVLGLDRAPEMKTLRRKIRQLAGLNKTMEFMEQSAKRHLSRKKGARLWVSVDGHVSVYSGKRKLAEHYVTRLRLALPSVLDYWVNDERGDPIMVLQGIAKKGMVQLLPRLIQQLRQLGETRPVTVIFDREGWSPAMFAKLMAMDNVYFLTYRKAKAKKKLPRVPSGSFRTHQAEIDGQPVTYELADTIVRITYGKGKRLRLRQITRRREGGVQTHILTNDFTTDALTLAHRMFGRWSQENFFKYMGEEQDFDGLLTYAVEDADGDRQVANPEKRKLSRKIHQIQQELESLTKEYGARALNNPEQRRPTMRGFKIANGDLARQIRTLTSQLDALQRRNNALPAKIPVRETLNGNSPQQVHVETRRLISCFRVAAHRAESALRELLRPHYRRWRQDGRTIIQSMLQSSGDLEVRDGELRVTIAAQSAPHRTQALAQLCSELNTLDVRFPGSDLRLKFAVREPTLVS